jgi:hypothetical protein
MKKILALLLALLMLASLAACAGTPTTTVKPSETTAPSATTTEGATVPTSADGKYPAETVKIGFINYDTTAEQVLSIQKYFEYLQTAFNFEIVWSESLQNAEQELAFIEQCASAGCKAVIGYYNVSEEEAAKKAADLKMYYWGSMGGAQEVYDAVKTNPYYLGSSYNPTANYDLGYNVGKAAVDAGCTKLILASGGADMGVPFFIQRREGFQAAIDEANAAGKKVTVVQDVGGWPGTEAFAAGQTAALGKDVDALCSTFTALPWLAPMGAAQKELKVFSGDGVSEATVGLMMGGKFTAIFSEIPDAFGMAIPMILNAAAGYSDKFLDNGSAPRVLTNNWAITKAEDAAYYLGVENAAAGFVWDIDDVKSVLYAYNNKANFKALCDLYQATAKADIEARRAD